MITTRGKFAYALAALAVGVGLVIWLRSDPWAFRLPALPTESSQLIVVTSPNWRSPQGTLVLLERGMDGDPWRQNGAAIPISLGRAGMGWGLGLHDKPWIGPSTKIEGDGKSPAGVFEFDEVFGTSDGLGTAAVHFPHRHMTRDFEGVDDPRSKFYNRVVQRSAVVPDWRSSESMVRDDGQYRVGLVVKHNWNQVPKAGSCIFLHVWKGEGMPTSGCTAMAFEDMARIVHWLDASRRPILVQMPEEMFAKVRHEWRLPSRH